jgi:mono/diheme cytochrome c family protein
MREVNVFPFAAKTLGSAAAIGAAIFLLGAAISIAPRPATALPAYAQQTGLSCGKCHANAAGSGPRTAYGNAFAANGHKLPGKK